MRCGIRAALVARQDFRIKSWSPTLPLRSSFLNSGFSCPSCSLVPHRPSYLHQSLATSSPHANMVKPAFLLASTMTRDDGPSQASSSKTATVQTLAFSRPAPVDVVSSAPSSHTASPAPTPSSSSSKTSATTRTIVPYHIPDMLFLPRTMDAWPWKRTINSHCETVKKDANEWFYAFHPFSPKSLVAFDRCDLGAFCSCSVSLRHLALRPPVPRGP